MKQQPIRYHKLRFILLLLIFLLITSACVPDPRTTNFQDQDPTVTTSPLAPPGGNSGPHLPPVGDVELGEGPGDKSMEGTWLLGWSNSICVPSYGEQVGVSYQLVKITQKGNTLQQEHKICNYNLSKVSIAQPEIPQSVRDTAIIISPNFGYVSGTAVGDSYLSPTIITTFGYHADQQSNPAKDPIPQKGDPLIFDSDKDGEPGANFLLHLLGKTCHRHTVQRQVTQYVGTFEKPNLITGKTYDHTESILINYSGGIGCGEVSVPTANDKYSEFRMARIDGKGGSTNADVDADDDITCDEVAGYISKIITVHPPDASHCP